MKLLKNTLLGILITVCSFFTINVWAASGDTASSSSEGIKVIVTEEIPGLCTEGEGGKITCTVGKGFDGVLTLMGTLIKYFTFLAALGGVLFIVINGIMYSMSGAGGDTAKAKGRIIGTLIGLIVLLLSGFILNAIAPWVYK